MIYNIIAQLYSAKRQQLKCNIHDSNEVTGIHKDSWLGTHRVQVEEDEQGYYISRTLWSTGRQGNKQILNFPEVRSAIGFSSFLLFWGIGKFSFKVTQSLIIKYAKFYYFNGYIAACKEIS